VERNRRKRLILLIVVAACVMITFGRLIWLKI
jgi:hypothetical protein